VAVQCVQSKNASGALFSGGSSALAFDAPTAAGNLVVVAVYFETTRTLSSIADGVNSAYSSGAAISVDGTFTVLLYYGQQTSSAQTVTVTLGSSTAATSRLAIYEFSGCATTTPVNDSDTAQIAPGTTHQTAAVDMGSAGGVYVGCLAASASNTFTGDADYTSSATGYSLSGYHIVSTTTSESMTATTSGTRGSINALVAFSAAAASFIPYPLSSRGARGGLSVLSGGLS
jgi:hypothetical protein